MENTEMADEFSATSTPEDEEFLRSLLSDVSAESTPDNSPPHMFEDFTPEVSPVHWSQELNPVVPELSELSLELNPDLLYGSNFSTDFGNYINIPISEAPTTPPKSQIQIPSQLPPAINTPIATQIPLVPIVQPPIQALPIVQPPHVQVPIVVEPPKKNRASSKKRARSDTPTVPSPQDKVALPRDTLLNITSQSMEQYVENLQSSRQLTNDDQKELKRQKRLIKNRESAQLSRERKRAYIDQLEARIAQLMADNGQLKADNNNLREALSHYQGPDGVKVEPSQDIIAHGKVAPTQHQIKMGNLLTIGSRSTATAGVCLLIVLFSFGLFMNNVNKPATVVTRFPATISQNPVDVFGDRRAIAPIDIGYKRGLLEAFPEVKEEEMDQEPVAKLPRALPYERTESSTSKDGHRHVIRVGSSSTPSYTNTNSPKFQQSLEINKAGVFQVSYTPKPASFLDNDGKHTHEGSNNTFTLILDPRPDLEDDTDVENTSAPVSATHETQIQVSSPNEIKKTFPPMIISLVIPEDIANGSNPLLLPEGLNPSNSLMEITCQVIDISITTSERPRD